MASSAISVSSAEEEEYEYEYSDEDMFSDVSENMSDEETSLSLPPTAKKELPFACHEEADVLSKANALVAQTSALLSLPASHSRALLRHFKWDENRLNDEWFSNEAKVREKVGLTRSEAGEGSTSETVCGICFDTFAQEEMFAMRCGHGFCRGCWKSYANSAIDDGPSCLELRCIHPDCKHLVTEDVLLPLIGEGDRAKRYKFFSTRSFVEGSRMLQWCPAPGCSKVIEAFDSVGSTVPMDVACACGHGFCFTCGEESHRPANCKMREKWVIKNSAESENLNWILANSKPCPKCKRPIEKNYGCMHMTCAVCKHEFCWLCLGAWSEHGERTGGYYSCNKYESSKEKGDRRRGEKKRRDFARASLERYMHYFERWNANKTSCTKAREQMNKFVGAEDSLTTVSINTRTPLSQLSFITEAWEIVIQCRRTLTWSYVYGYYTYDNMGNGSGSGEKEKKGKGEKEGDRNLKAFFEFLQGDAEYSLELLHNCVEVELQKFADEDCTEGVPKDEFNQFRSKLTGLSKVTKDYFEKLSYELENGLDEINAKYGMRCYPCA